MQEDYDAVDPSDDNKSPPMIDDVQGLTTEIEDSGYFESLGSRHYSFDVVYTAGEYVAVLDTYSGHRRLEATKRQDLYGRIRRRVESQSTATVTKTYLAILDVARKCKPRAS